MTDFILIEGDKANFLPNFGAAVVVVRPGNLKGSGPATLNGKKICVDGDEKKVVPPLYGALLKNEQDVQLFERLVFLSRRR